MFSNNIITDIKKLGFKKEKIVYNSFESMILAKNIGILHGKIRGGAWSALGKNVETSLMITLCNIFSVSSKNYSLKNYDHLSNDTEREVDFYFIDNDKNEYKCEVKLMGKGNPESGDSVFARGTKVFVADKLSSTLKNQLSDNNILFVELHQKRGFMKLYDVLKGLNINCVCPASIKTPMSTNPNMPADIDTRLLKKIMPLDGVNRSPDDIASTIAFLASDDAIHINGIDLRVDGGLLT